MSGARLPFQAGLLLHGSFSCCGSRAHRAQAVVMEHRSSCPEASGISLDQELNPCCLHAYGCAALAHQGKQLLSSTKRFDEAGVGVGVSWIVYPEVPLTTML